MVARFEGHTNTRKISPVSQFIAGGVAGMVSQAVVYPLDTLKLYVVLVPVGPYQNADTRQPNAMRNSTRRTSWNKTHRCDGRQDVG